jgi:hypothetical protein
LHEAHSNTFNKAYDVAKCPVFYRNETAYNASLLGSHMTQDDVVFLNDWIEDFQLRSLYNHTEMIFSSELVSQS